MEHIERDMKISTTIVRRLRTARGWSQEQLAAASGLGLRTIQRVEAEGRAARETRVCLAATFNVGLDELLEEADGEVVVMPAPSLRRYKIALAVAGIALVPVLLGYANIIGMTPIVSACFMVAIALFLYAGFGLYFTGAPRQAAGVRRYVQMAFIASAVFCAFAAFAQNNTMAVSLASQIAIVVLGVYFLFDYLRGRRQTSK